MSQKHPVVSITGSSGAGTTTVKVAFEHIFLREKINAAMIEGDSYHRYSRVEMKAQMADKYLSHFGPEANEFGVLADTFKTYGESGMCQRRYYLHNDDEAAQHNERLGIEKNPANSRPGKT